jgi:hypothetical protein
MSVIWVGKPVNLYIIETDQGRFKVEREYINYKATIKALKEKGYTNINITCLGKVHNY